MQHVHILQDLRAFLDASPTAYHAVEQIGLRFASLDFAPLDEADKWSLEPGKKYFVTRGGSIAVFTLPTQAPTRATIIASHTDSPALKLKPNPEIQKENMTMLGVEVYGGPMLSSWLNRDLKIAGRIVFTNAENHTEEKLVAIDDAALFIPQLPIHLDREINEKGLLLNKQEHIVPVATLDFSEKNYLETMLRRYCDFQKLLSFDLFLVPTEPSRYIGSRNEMLASYRLDNLATAHACATALALAKRASATLQMAIFWNNEEIGSRSAEGADSTFLTDILKRISHAYRFDTEDFMRFKSNSLCVSADMIHAFNPNYSAKFEPNHHVYLGKGIVIKYNADQKYATNAVTAAAIVKHCQTLGLHYQNFVSRSDIVSGGSTVGPVVAHNLGIATVDVGCPQLAMHAAREVMACQDYMDMGALLTEILSAE